MLRRLIPQEYDFFESFDRAAEQAVSAARLLLTPSCRHIGSVLPPFPRLNAASKPRAMVSRITLSPGTAISAPARSARQRRIAARSTRAPQFRPGAPARTHGAPCCTQRRTVHSFTPSAAAATRRLTGSGIYGCGSSRLLSSRSVYNLDACNAPARRLQASAVGSSVQAQVTRDSAKSRSGSSPCPRSKGAEK